LMQSKQRLHVVPKCRFFCFRETHPLSTGSSGKQPTPHEELFDRGYLLAPSVVCRRGRCVVCEKCTMRTHGCGDLLTPSVLGDVIRNQLVGAVLHPFHPWVW
jgi:hypothetical protein